MAEFHLSPLQFPLWLYQDRNWNSVSLSLCFRAQSAKLGKAPMFVNSPWDCWNPVLAIPGSESLLIQSLDVSLYLITPNGWESSAPWFKWDFCQTNGQPLWQCSCNSVMLSDVHNWQFWPRAHGMGRTCPTWNESLEDTKLQEINSSPQQQLHLLGFFTAYEKHTLRVSTPDCLENQNSQSAAAVFSLWRARRYAQKWDTTSVIYFK